MPASSPLRLLLVDPDPDAWGRLPEALRAAGYALEHVADAEAAAAAGPTDAVLVDSGPDGAAWLRRAAGLEDPPASILFDTFGSAGDAVDLLRAGADDVVARPASDEQVLAALRRALEARRLRRENRDLRDDLGGRARLAGLVSRDPRMRHLFELVEAVADSRASVLLLGESGTGKTRLARAIHALSGRADGPFVEVNCGALPPSLLESELFGHARGAFTGAAQDRPGKFEAADGGTLFLDELATATPELQVRLLRVLESGRFERVGEERTREVDVRLLSATNADLEAEVAAGNFREDLFYRVQVVALEVPPLRERPLDVPLLVDHFLDRFAREAGRPAPTPTPRALGALLAHAWPGNVRELEHALERAVLLSGGDALDLDSLPPAVASAAAGAAAPAAAPADPTLGVDALPLGPLKAMLEVPERAILLRALQTCDGSRKRTAALLAIDRTTLFNKMRKYGLLSFPTDGAASGAGGGRVAS